ncbi:MAG: hypothetical protein IIC18_08695 [Bacteroidetes bacterium]|nr:hypothetical protein [Bacteroidota bacterium]
MLPESTFLFFQRTHALSERLTLLLRERAETMVLHSPRLPTTVTELAGLPAMSVGTASLPHGLPAVVHGSSLMPSRLPLVALGSIHTLTLTRPRAAALGTR